jgi:hypothetical protein
MPGAGRKAFLHERKIARKYSKLVPKVLKLAEEAKARFPDVLTEQHIEIFSERIKGRSIAETAKELNYSLSTVKRYWKTTVDTISAIDRSLISRILELRAKKMSRELILERKRENFHSVYYYVRHHYEEKKRREKRSLHDLKVKREWLKRYYSDPEKRIRRILNARQRRQLAKDCKPFVDDLKSDDPTKIQAAIIAIAVRKYKGANKLIMDLTKHPVSYVAEEAIWALGELRVFNSVPTLISFLNRAESFELSKISAIMTALGKIANPDAIMTLLKYSSHSDPEIRECARKALTLVEERRGKINISISDFEDLKNRFKI